MKPRHDRNNWLKFNGASRTTIREYCAIEITSYMNRYKLFSHAGCTKNDIALACYIFGIYHSILIIFFLVDNKVSVQILFLA